MKRNIILTLILVTTFGACSKPISINFAPDGARAPAPYFVARDYSEDGARPTYSDIKVYELTDNCSIPNCPLMWHVAVSKVKSPIEIVYGGSPALGASTLTAAKELKQDGRYSLVLSSAESRGGETVDGRLDFTVEEDNRIVVVD